MANRSKVEATSAVPEPSDGEKLQSIAREPDPVNGVFIVRNIDGQGNIGVDLQLIGDTRLTEVDTILKLGLRALNSKLDL